MGAADKINAMTNDLNTAVIAAGWPASPAAGYVPDLSNSESDTVRVDLAQGTHVSGRLTRFDLAEAVLNITLSGMTKPMSMKFDLIKAVHLLAPLRAMDDAARSKLPAARYFKIRYRDGTVVNGETFGVVEESQGVFIFVSASDAMQRMFVPHAACSKFELGGPVLSLMDPLQFQSGSPEATQVSAAATTSLDGFVIDLQDNSANRLWETVGEQDARKPVALLGELLLERGLVTREQLNAALEAQIKNKGKPLGRVLVDMNMIDEVSLQIALASKLGLPIVAPDQFPVEDSALALVPARVANRLKIVPIAERNGMLAVALEDPWRTDALDEVKFMSQRKIVPVLAPFGSVDRALRKVYKKSRKSSDATATAPVEFEPSNVAELADQLLSEQDIEHVAETNLSENDTALTKLVNTMIQDAYTQGVSDIHIETYPGNDPTVIRFRKDGDLQTYLDLPASYRRALVARIKIMATLDISERRKPQDGKIDFSKFGKIKLELRVATIPTTNGLEDVVMRLLASSKPVPLAKLGLSEYNTAQVKTITERPYGIFLVCGPTGSGKTTTLHSCLAHINTPERKIWTAEDPVEITQRGLRQVQVNPKIGWTFADALRAFLRADPDVVMIGEMRDFETARIAIEASLTGHLVLSTLHTNSAPESIVRLLDFGLDPFNFSDALLGVLAQRLVRRICPECRKSTPARDIFIAELVEDYARHIPEDSPLKRSALVADWRARFGDEQGRLLEWHSAGCDACGGTGFKGRAGIHELLVANMDVKRLVQTKGRVEDVQHAASLNGMRTLRQDGIEKILQGVTELGEVRAASN